jgi:hypothetical protein
MPDPQTVQLPFGPGLDKETGVMVVRPQTMQDLRNVYHHEGSLVVREGVEKTNEFFDGETGWSQGGWTGGTGDPATHILAGQAIRSERAGIVVSWESTVKRVAVWRVNGLGEESQFIGFWPFRSDVDGTVVRMDWPFDEPPKVILAEMYGQVFFAHDHYYDTFRADTYHYDPWGVNSDQERFRPLTATFCDDEEEVLRFRGVVRHLHYLFGWGYGASCEQPRPELVRVSYPGEPAKFDPMHYFIAGDRRDPVVACKPARQTLIVCKETESYQIIGYSRANFGIRPYDQLYGALASRLLVSVSGNVYVWSQEGPMVGGDVGPFRKIWLPLDLGGFEPATLVERVDFDEGWADYIDEVELVIYCFGRRAYVLSVRNPQDPRWTYWELGKKAYCGFRLWGGEDVGPVPGGDPTVNSIVYDVEGCGQYPRYTLTINNDQQQGSDLAEIWHRPTGPFWGDNLISDPLDQDADGDGVPTNWVYDASGPSLRKGYQAQQNAYWLAVYNAVDTNTTTAHYARLYWQTPTVTVGTKYRFRCRVMNTLIDNSTFNNSPYQIEVQFYDIGDAPVGSLFSRDVRHPSTPTSTGAAFRDAFIEVTAPASASYARAAVTIRIKAARDQGSVYFNNPSWREQDTTPGTWVPATAPEPVIVDSTQEMPPVTVEEPGMDYDIAVRYVNIGQQPTPGYESDDPSLWPSYSAGYAQIPMDAPDWNGAYPGLDGPSFFNSLPGGLHQLLLAPGCDPNNGIGTEFPKYTNRDMEIQEDEVTVGYLARGNLLWTRQVLQSELNESHQYRARYLGPDRDSPWSAVLNAQFNAGGVDLSIPPSITGLSGSQAVGSYVIGITRSYDTYDDLEGNPKQVGVIIQDNFTEQGGGGTLPAGEWNTVWVSQRRPTGPAGDQVWIDCVFPGCGTQYQGTISHSQKAKDVLISIRVLQFYEPFPSYLDVDNFTPTATSEWSEVAQFQYDDQGTWIPPL